MEQGAHSLYPWGGRRTHVWINLLIDKCLHLSGNLGSWWAPDPLANVQIHRCEPTRTVCLASSESTMAPQTLVFWSRGSAKWEGKGREVG
jgi:hypothetical protein